MPSDRTAQGNGGIPQGHSPNLPTLVVTLGFDGELRLLYPNGKSIDLPKGDAEARMREILEGFKKDLRTYRKEVQEVIYNQIPVKHYGKGIKLSREVTLSDLGLD